MLFIKQTAIGPQSNEIQYIMIGRRAAKLPEFKVWGPKKNAAPSYSWISYVSTKKKVEQLQYFWYLKFDLW